MFQKKTYRRYSKQKPVNAAYWIGVGLSASRDNRFALLDSKNPKFRKSIRNAEVDNEKELIEYHKDFLMKINYRLLRIVAKISKDNNEL